MTVEVTYENYQKSLKITRLIDAKLNRIWEDTKVHSNLQIVVDHPAFKELVEMGPKIIPYIVHYMTQKKADWTHMMLLGTITKENPIAPQHAGNFNMHLAEWIIWYEHSKYKCHDVYYGLLNEET